MNWCRPRYILIFWSRIICILGTIAWNLFNLIFINEVISLNFDINIIIILWAVHIIFDWKELENYKKDIAKVNIYYKIELFILWKNWDIIFSNTISFYLIYYLCTVVCLRNSISHISGFKDLMAIIFNALNIMLDTPMKMHLHILVRLNVINLDNRQCNCHTVPYKLHSDNVILSSWQNRFFLFVWINCRECLYYYFLCVCMRERERERRR